MYIALRWLILLTISMWAALCFNTAFEKNTAFERNIKKGFNKFLEDPANIKTYNLSNDITKTIGKPDIPRVKSRSYTKRVGWRGINSTLLLHYLMFFAGAAVVLIYNNKKMLLEYIARMKNSKRAQKYIHFFKLYVSNIILVSLETFQFMGGKFKISYQYCLSWIIWMESMFGKEIRGNMSQFEVKELERERDTLAQLLVFAIKDNIRIKQEHHLDVLAKNRLLRQVADLQKRIRTDRINFVNMEHTYLYMRQENCFLKAKLEKLITERNTTEKYLRQAIQEMSTKKNGISSVCSKFVVKTPENLSMTNIVAEIEIFKKQCVLASGPSASSFVETDGTRKEVFYDTNQTVTAYKTDHQTFNEETQHASKDTDCVWMVKDQHGLIEKLYEYDVGFKEYGEENIKRIREYSVFHKQDRLVDVSNLSDSVSISQAIRSLPFHKMEDYNHSDMMLRSSQLIRRFQGDSPQTLSYPHSLDPV